MDDREDVRKLRRGDADAFARLFDRYSLSVYRYTSAVLRDRQYTEDVLQETFLTLWQHREDLDLHGDSLLPWLLATSRNHSHNLGRRLRRRETVMLPDDPASPSRADPGEVATQREALRAVAQAIADLSPVDQALVRATVLNDIPYAEAAAAVGLSPSAAARRVQRIRVRLRKFGELL